MTMRRERELWRTPNVCGMRGGAVESGEMMGSPDWEGRFGEGAGRGTYKGWGWGGAGEVLYQC